MKGFRWSQSRLWKQYEVRWENQKQYFFSERILPPQIASKRYIRFSRLTNVPINGRNRFMGVPKCHFWKQLNVEHYQIQFVSKKVVPSRIHFGKDGFTPHNSTKSLMAMNINHFWKHASLYCTTREVISEHVVLPHLRTILYLKLNARWAMPRTRLLSKKRFLCKLKSRKL